MNTYQVKISLKGIKPSIYRTINIPENISFNQLHRIIQCAFGFYDGHLFEFSYRGEVIGKSNKIDRYLLNFPQINYIYDFGDGWEFTIKLQKVLPDYSDPIPFCISFQGPNCVDDIGGIGGLEHLLFVLKNSNHPEYEEMSEWAEMMGYEPEVNLLEMNNSLKKCIRLPKIK